MYSGSTITDMQKIGLGLLGFGSLFLFLGVVLLFDSALLALGNILFLAGLGCLIGAKGTLSFFFKGDSCRGAVFFFGGVLVVFFGYPLIGMILETYGVVKLFRRFMPVIIRFLYGVPVIGWFLWLPGVNKVVDMIGGQPRTMV